MKLIDADKLKAHYAWWKGGSREMTMDEAKSDFDTIVDLQPTVEVEPFKAFACWVASEVCNEGFEEMWTLGAFAEVACRKLYALGIVQKFRDEWVYVDKDELESGENESSR